MKKAIDNAQFLEIKSKLGQAESAVKQIPMSAITVDENTLKKNQIQVNGNPVRVSNQFFSRLGSMLKLSSGLTRGMIDKGDTHIAAALINGIKDYQSANRKNNDVMLIANVASKEVVDICEPARYKRVTNDTLFDVTERILNDNPTLKLETVDFNSNSGRASVNFLSDKEVGFAEAGEDEFFKFGFSIIQTNKDTMVETYNQRLICTNGLRTSLGEGAIGGNSNRALNFVDKFRLGGTSSEEIKIFLNQIEEMKKAGFIPGGFESSITRAMGTKASLYEVEKSLKLAVKKLDEPDTDLKNQYHAAIARNYFQGHGMTAARINKKGTDASKLNDRQKAFIKTPMSIWDVVNSMTFLGSNDTGIPLTNQHELKYSAGELFAKGVKEGYDLEFAQYANL